MTTQYPLSLEEFKSWLESKKEEEVVGTKGYCAGCPIFKCLKTKNENVTCVVGDTTVFKIEGVISEIKNPNWVQEFVSQTDKNLDMYNLNMTAKQALEVLNNFLICTKCNKRNEQGTNCGRQDCDW